MKTTKLLFLTITALFLMNCGDDEDSRETLELVTVKHNTGVLYKIDKTTGDLTEIHTLTYGGSPLTYLNSLVFHPGTGTYFAGSSGNGYGHLYSIDPKTGIATLLNNNNDSANGNPYHWLYLNDLVVMPDGNILAVSSLQVGSPAGFTGDGLILFDTQGNVIEYIQSDAAVSGMVYGMYKTKMYGSYSYLRTVEVADGHATMGPTINFTEGDGFDHEINFIGAVVMFNMVKDPDNSTLSELLTEGEIYGLMYDGLPQDEYIVRINPLTGRLDNIGFLINGGTTVIYHGLALVPESRLP